VRCLCCECPYFRLDRVQTRRVGLMEFDGAIVLTNLGNPVLLETQGITESIAHAETVLLPAACPSVEVQANRELLLTYLPQTTLRFAE
jgi:hypothetical protein